jgi:hypothetical protein
MKNKQLLTGMAAMALTFAVTVSAFAQSGDDSVFSNGGRGIRFGVLLPAGIDLPDNDKWTLSYTQAILTDNFIKYSDMTVIDKQNIDQILDEQIKSLSGNYSEETEVLIGHMIDSEYDLYGRVQKIPGSRYSVSLSVTKKETGERIASFQDNCSLLQLQQASVLNKATVSLLEQMGIALTDSAKQALGSSQDDIVIAAQSALAKGITAERIGAKVEALSYYYQAASFDSVSREIGERLSNASMSVFTGDLQGNLQNEIQQKNEWLQVLNDCAQAYNDVIPFELVMRPLEIGDIDIINEKQNLLVPVRLVPVPSALSLLDRVLQELVNTRKMDKFGFNSPDGKYYREIGKSVELNRVDLRGWPKYGLTSGALQPVTFHKGFTGSAPGDPRMPGPEYVGIKSMSFEVVVALINKNGKEFRKTASLRGEIHYPSYLGFNKNSSFGRREKDYYRTSGFWYESNTGFKLRGDNFNGREFSFVLSVDDLTDTYTIKIISINGIDAETAALTGYMQTSTLDEFNRRHSINP